MSRYITRSRARQSTRTLRTALHGSYAPKPDYRAATVVSRTLAGINGSIFPASDLGAPSGQVVAVVNKGRPAAALYGPESSGLVVISGAGATVGGGEPPPGTGGGMVVHGLSERTWHSGTLDDPYLTRQYLYADGSRALSGDLAVADGVTMDGVDLSVHVTLPDVHHARHHDIVGPDHTATGNPWDIVGIIASNTLGYVQPTWDPGLGERLLRTGTNGYLRLGAGNLVINPQTQAVAINASDNGAAALQVQGQHSGQIAQIIRRRADQNNRIWRVADSDDSDLIVLDSVGNLQSGRPGFVSGFTGWRITPWGDAEFNNLRARGELHASVFVLDEAHAEGGTLYITGAAALTADVYLNSTAYTSMAESVRTTSSLTDSGVLEIRTTSTTGDGNNIYLRSAVEELPIEASPSGFPIAAVGDFLMAKFWWQGGYGYAAGIYWLWWRVIGVEAVEDHYVYAVQRLAGSDCLIAKGTALINYKSPGEGMMMLTSDLGAESGYAPYLQTFVVGDTPWQMGDIPTVRVGQLSGIGLPGIDPTGELGMAASPDLSSNLSPYLIASDKGIRLYRSDLRMNDGTFNTARLTSSGDFKLGPNVDNVNQVLLHFDPLTSTLVIGNDALPGNVDIKGDFLAGYATTEYVNTQDTSTYNTVTGETNTKLTSYQQWGQDAKGQLLSHMDRLDVAVLDFLTDQSGNVEHPHYPGGANNPLMAWINSATQAAIDDANSARVHGWENPPSPKGRQAVEWSVGAATTRVRNGRGVWVTLAAPSGGAVTLTDFTLFHANIKSATAVTRTVFAVTDASLVPAGNTVLFTGQPTPAAASGDPAKEANVQVVGGRVYISGDWLNAGIITTSMLTANSIQSRHIVAGTITAGLIGTNAVFADRMLLTSALALYTNGKTFIYKDDDGVEVTGTSAGAAIGTLGSGGALRPFGDTTQGGIYLGWTGGAGGRYVFEVAQGSGSTQDYIRYDPLAVNKFMVNGGAFDNNSITLNTRGFLHTDGKDSVIDTTQGIWMGYTGGLYKWAVGSGDIANSLTARGMMWDGDSLTIRANSLTYSSISMASDIADGNHLGFVTILARQSDDAAGLNPHRFGIEIRDSGRTSANASSQSLYRATLDNNMPSAGQYGALRMFEAYVHPVNIYSNTTGLFIDVAGGQLAGHGFDLTNRIPIDESGIHVIQNGKGVAGWFTRTTTAASEAPTLYVQNRNANAPAIEMGMGETAEARGIQFNVSGLPRNQQILIRADGGTIRLGHTQHQNAPWGGGAIERVGELMFTKEAWVKATGSEPYPASKDVNAYTGWLKVKVEGTKRYDSGLPGGGTDPESDPNGFNYIRLHR